MIEWDDWMGGTRIYTYAIETTGWLVGWLELNDGNEYVGRLGIGILALSVTT